MLGGWLTENYSWRYAFYINLPVGSLDLLGLLALLPDPQAKTSEKLDWFGCFWRISACLYLKAS